MPFCPKCKKEYQQNIKSCYYCGIELVNKLPEGVESVPFSRAKRIPKYSSVTRTFNSAKSAQISETDPLVTIETYHHPDEALAAQSKLASHNIKSYLANENLVVTNLRYIGRLGELKLQVRKSEAENGLTFLKEVDIQPAVTVPGNDAKPVSTCPQCNNTDVYEAKLLFSSKWKCRGCGFAWKPGKENQS
jgi:predicted RNA-binding Zn-ribbon protein involved in translation (DUF1610 family)